MKNLASPCNLLVSISILSVYAVPTPTPASEDEVATSEFPNNLTVTSPVRISENLTISQNLSEVAKTIAQRTGKAIGVPSDFTKQFNISVSPTSSEDQDAPPAQLNAEPAGVTGTSDHPGSDIQLTEEIGITGNGSGDANDSMSDAYAKPVEAVEPRLLYVAPDPTVKAPEDKVIQRIFGGVCTLEVWNHCSRIKFWGGDYLVPDKNNPERMIKRHHKIRCQDPSEKNLCLRNGWTVARCHMLCMSQCNVDFRLNYDKLVSHEGDCKMPLLLKK